MKLLEPYATDHMPPIGQLFSTGRMKQFDLRFADTAFVDAWIDFNGDGTGGGQSGRDHVRHEHPGF